MNIFKKLKYYIMYRRAVIMANDAYSETRNRYYVIPTPEGKLMVVDRTNFRLLKRKHYFNPNATLNHLAAECFYHTPHADGTRAMSPKEAKARRTLYWQWANLHELRKKKKKQ